MVDSSGSMNSPAGNWDNTKEWMKNLAVAFEIDGQHHRIGLIRWSSSVHHESTVRFSDNLSRKLFDDKQERYGQITS